MGYPRGRHGVAAGRPRGRGGSASGSARVSHGVGKLSARSMRTFSEKTLLVAKHLVTLQRRSALTSRARVYIVVWQSQEMCGSAEHHRKLVEWCSTKHKERRDLGNSRPK